MLGYEEILKIIPIESIKSLQKQSITVKEMLTVLRNSREEELELED